MKKLMLFVLMLFICTYASAVQIHRDPNEMDTIGPVFKNEPIFRPQYTGQKDRYCEACLRNDPEVLMSIPKQEPKVLPLEKDVITKVVYVQADKEPVQPLYVKATIEGEDFNPSPVTCTQTNDTIKCEW